ncbi:MAG TPA: hypothetical protein ENN41_10595 [Sediminispirochaeta sp.]|nr:hypothetical protein [Sediminispirochaeta sp.]
MFAQSSESFVAEGEHYSVTSTVSETFSADVLEFMEAFYGLYRSYMHFDPTERKTSMRVQIFGKKSEFDAYLRDVLGESRDSFVFLQYQDPKKSRLVGYRGESEEQLWKSLIHHGYVQYIKTFIPGPPLWMQKGFAVYFENCRYDWDRGEVVFRPNYGWVQSLRDKLDRDPSISDRELFIPVEQLLTIDQAGALDNLGAFYSQSWALIHFLLHSEQKSYNRLLWDSISALSPQAEQDENERRIISRAFEWVNKEQLLEDFLAHVDGIQTFPDLVQGGINAYEDQSYQEAVELFQRALELRNNHYVPEYYLGLIAYQRGDYSKAEYHYLEAVDHDGMTDLLYYALGVNAYADERRDESLYYLQQALEFKGDYGQQAQELIARIEKERAGSEDS